jgi:hypothetical protein
VIEAFALCCHPQSKSLSVDFDMFDKQAGVWFYHSIIDMRISKLRNQVLWNAELRQCGNK